ncbi:MAG: hypothetical protein ABJG86_03435 [Nitratireductor sp.]
MNLATWLVRTARLCPDRPASMRGAAPVADYSASAGAPNITCHKGSTAGIRTPAARRRERNAA